MRVVDLLSELEGKNVALFGTCGMGTNEEYYKSIEQKVKVWLPEDCRYLGAYMCPVSYTHLKKDARRESEREFKVKNLY